MSFYGSCDYGGEPYDYEDTPNYWSARDMERMIIEEEKERRLENV